MPDPPVLHNIRILDFSWVLAGPYATRLLADYGAEVIKIQPLLPEADDKFSRSYYDTWNRNKLGITLNLSRAQGLEIAARLIKISDIIVENFSSRVMENWGLDYPGVKKLNPDIIFLSMSVMGHSGPWRNYSGFGPAVQAFSGITRLTAYPGQPPSGIGYAYADHIAGLYGSLALLGALEYRRRTGQGQFIDLSQTETMTSLLSDAVLDCTMRGREAKPVGNTSAGSVPCGVYPCRGKDRWCAIEVSTAEEWEGFKRALGQPAWMNEERFATIASRQRNREALDRFVQAWTKHLPAEEVAIALQEEGVPAGLARNAAELVNDPQMRDREFFLTPADPDFAGTVVDASPIRLADSPASYRRAAPVRGQDNEYVYRRLLGLSEDEISGLKQDNII
ncbi:MAG: CoA transferase [Dehalococcoidales bacterium]|nr:CoA transferase [Dehalococcoidales bacterium]